MDIQVRVADGVATLSGIVDSWNEYTSAAEIAYEAGARSVKNHLSVREEENN